MGTTYPREPRAAQANEKRACWSGAQARCGGRPRIHVEVSGAAGAAAGGRAAVGPGTGTTQGNRGSRAELRPERGGQGGLRSGGCSAEMAAKVFESIGKLGLGLAVAGGVVNSALYNVDAGHRAVIFDRFRGVQDVVVGEGTHFLIPWVQKPIIFDCRSRPRNVPVITGSKDLQNVNITLRILFRPVTAQLPRIFTSIGEDYDERVLPSITTEILKSVVVSTPWALLAQSGECALECWGSSLVWVGGSWELIQIQPCRGLPIPSGLALGTSRGGDSKPPWEAFPFHREIPAAVLAGAAWRCVWSLPAPSSAHPIPSSVHPIPSRFQQCPSCSSHSQQCPSVPAVPSSVHPVPAIPSSVHPILSSVHPVPSHSQRCPALYSCSQQCLSHSQQCSLCSIPFRPVPSGVHSVSPYSLPSPAVSTPFHPVSSHFSRCRRALTRAS
uniref:Prohibitin 1 n=2 Tax=Passeriformes TaxID=9126 RepID=A0A8C5IYR5_JUNHY